MDPDDTGLNTGQELNLTSVDDIPHYNRGQVIATSGVVDKIRLNEHTDEDIIKWYEWYERNYERSARRGRIENKKKKVKNKTTKRKFKNKKRRTTKRKSNYNIYSICLSINTIFTSYVKMKNIYGKIRKLHKRSN